MENRRLVREADAREYLGGMSHGAFYELRRRGIIDVVHIGRACYYELKSLDQAVDRLKQEQETVGVCA